MVWSACVLAPTNRDAARAAAGEKVYVLRKKKLPCSYRVPILFSERIVRNANPKVIGNRSVWRFGDSVPPVQRSRDSTDLKFPSLTVTSNSTNRRSAQTAESDIAYVEKIQDAIGSKLIFKDLQDRNMMRLAENQIARQQQSIRSGERKAVERAIGFRVQAPLVKWDKQANVDDLEYFLMYVDNLKREMAVQWMNLGEGTDQHGNIAWYRLNSSQYRIRERLWRADMKARERIQWHDDLNKWIKLQKAGDQSKGFWKFVNGKQLLKWNADPFRFHDCHCRGRCGHMTSDSSQGFYCETCELHWEAYSRYIDKMKARLKLFQQGKTTKEEMRLLRIEEAKKLRDFLEELAKADRRAKQKLLLRQQRPTTRLRRPAPTAIDEEEDFDDQIPSWDDEDDEELMEIIRNESESGSSPSRDLGFQDKMYDLGDGEESVAQTPSPVAEASQVQTESPDLTLDADLNTPSSKEKTSKKKKERKNAMLKLPRAKAKRRKPLERSSSLRASPTTPRVLTPLRPKSVELGERRVLKDDDIIFLERPRTPPPPIKKKVTIKAVGIDEYVQEKKPLKRMTTRPILRQDPPQPPQLEDDFDFLLVENPAEPEEPAKVRLQRPDNWGKKSSVGSELTMHPSKGASKRRALDKAFAKRQQAARNRKKKKQRELEFFEEEEDKFDPDWLDQFFYLYGDKKMATKCRWSFTHYEPTGNGKLDFDQTFAALQDVNPNLRDREIGYMKKVLELIGVDLLTGVDLKLFTIIGAFSQRLTALDGWIRTMLNELDTRLLEYKFDNCKKFWLTCSDNEKRMSEDQFRIILLAGGVTAEHERSACTKLFENRPEPHFLDLLDFLTYLPLFIAIHLRVLQNPVDNARNM